jgi:hypothetical protein
MHFVTALLLYFGILLLADPAAEETALPVPGPEAEAAVAEQAAPASAEREPLDEEARPLAVDGRGERIRTSDLCNPIAAR